MKIRLIILNILIILFNYIGLFSQTWERTYGNIYWDGGRSVQQTNDGGYIIGGYTGSDGITQDGLYLIKSDKFGNTEWTKIYGGLGCVGRSVKQIDAYGYISVGSCWNRDYYCIKTDSLGDSLWVREWGTNNHDTPYSVCQVSDKGYAIIGLTRLNGNDNRVYFVRIDSIGDTMWTRIYGSVYCEGRSIDRTEDNGFIITGTIYPTGYYANIYLIKTDSIGDTLWTKIFGDTIYASETKGYDVDKTNDGGYIIIGTILLKADSLGDSLWAREISGVAGQQTSDGGYVIVSTIGVYPYTDICLTKTDSVGTIEWSRTFGGDSSDFGYSVQQTTDGGYIIAGETYSYGAGECDVYVIKTDSLGYVGIEEKPVQQYPEFPNISIENRSSGQVKISFIQSHDGYLNFSVYDLSGRMIDRPLEGFQEEGEHSITLTGYRPGVYFYQMISGEEEHRGKFQVY